MKGKGEEERDVMRPNRKRDEGRRGEEEEGCCEKRETRRDGMFRERAQGKKGCAVISLKSQRV